MTACEKMKQDWNTGVTNESVMFFKPSKKTLNMTFQVEISHTRCNYRMESIIIRVINYQNTQHTYMHGILTV